MPQVYNKYHYNIPKDAVYIGRGSKWGNPHPIGYCLKCSDTHSRREAIMAYAAELKGLDVINIQEELKGKDLVCFCKPKDCHGDILLIIANSEAKNAGDVGSILSEHGGPDQQPVEGQVSEDRGSDSEGQRGNLDGV